MKNSDQKAIDGAYYVAYLAEIKYVIRDIKKQQEKFTLASNGFFRRHYENDEPIKEFRLSFTNNMRCYIDMRTEQINNLSCKAEEIGRANDFDLTDLEKLIEESNTIRTLFLKRAHEVQEKFRN